MRTFLFIILVITLISGASLANNLSDQDTFGTKKATISHSSGDRSLVATGGFPFVEPINPESEIDVTSNTRIPGYTQWKRDESGGSLPLWGTDILVSPDDPTLDPFLLRDTNTGTLYAVYRYTGGLIPATSSITIFSSTDEGLTWNYVLDSWPDDTTLIYNTDACIDDDSDSTFIFVICNAQDDDIWIMRYNITGGYTDWVQITSGSVYDPAIDELNDNPLHFLYMTYLVNANTVRFRVSSDYGLSWTSPYDVYSGTCHNPDIRINAGTNIWAYILWDNGPIIYSKANDWQGFDGWAGIAEKIHNFRGGSDDVNGQIAVGWDSDTAWVVGEENLNNSGDWNLVWDFSLNGLSWQNDTIFPNVDLVADPARDELNHRLVGHPNLLDRARIAYLSDSRVDYQYFGGASWSATIGVGDFSADVGSRPSSAFVPAGGGGAVLYNTTSDVWFDYYSGTGVEEKPQQPTFKIQFNASSLTKGNVRIEFILPKQGNVSLKAYNVTGRVVGTILNGAYAEGQHNHTWNANLSTGQYFLRLETERGTSTKSVIILR